MSANPSPLAAKIPSQPVQVNLYEAKTQLSSLVDRAAKGEEIVIAKAGKPMVKLTPVVQEKEASASEPLPFGKNLLGITFISDDFYEDLPPELFESGESDSLFLPEKPK